MKFIRKNSPWIALATIFIIIFLVRFNAVNKYSAPPSEDLAGDLNVLNAYIESDPVRPYFRYQSPPIYYFLVVLPSISIFPTLLGLKIYDALLPTLIAIPFFLFCREVSMDNFGALLATALFTFSEIYNEMMGWGGTLNLFGIFFMLLSAYFLVKALKKSRLKDIILAGVFLSLVFGTHHFSAAYYLIVILLLAIILTLTKVFPFRQVVKQFTVLLSTGSLLSLPYTYVYVYMVSNRVNIASNFILSRWVSFLLLFSLGRSLPVYVTIVFLGICGFICMFRYRPRSVSAVPTAFLSAAVCLSFILNPESVDRASYFVPIAIFSAAAVFFSEIRRLLPKADNLLRLMALALLVITVPVLFEGAYVRLNGAIDFYHIADDDAVSALNWIRENTTENAVIFTNYNALGMWIEGYANRKSLAPKPLAYFVTKPDYEEASAANRINAGNYVIENGYLQVTDYIPAGYDNPGIYIGGTSYYEPLLFFDDAHQNFAVSSMSQQTTVRSNLLSANKTIDKVSVQNNAVTVTYNYSWSYGTILRQVKLCNEPRIFVTYEITLVDFLILEFNLRPIVYPANRVESLTINNTDLFLEILTPSNNEVDVKLAPINLTNNSFNVTYETTVLQSAILTVNEPTSQMKFTLEVDVSSSDHSISDVQFTDSIGLFRDYNVSYLLLDKNNYAQLVRFTKGPKIFIPVFENEGVLIVKFGD